MIAWPELPRRGRTEIVDRERDRTDPTHEGRRGGRTAIRTGWISKVGRILQSVLPAEHYRARCRQNTTERSTSRMLQSALPAERYRARCLWMVQLSMGHDRIVVRSQQSQRLVIKLISEHLPYLAVMCGAAGREHLVWLHLNNT